MAYQLFTMLAKLNLLLGNNDNYNVYFYIYDFIHFTFSFIHWLDGKILKSHNDTFLAFSNAAMLNRCAGHQIRANCYFSQIAMNFACSSISGVSRAPQQ